MDRYPTLFSPFRLDGLTLVNRIPMASMFRGYLLSATP